MFYRLPRWAWPRASLCPPTPGSESFGSTGSCVPKPGLQLPPVTGWMGRDGASCFSALKSEEETDFV